MKNKILMKEKLISVGMTLGCYDTTLEKLSKKELDKVLENMEYGSTDIAVTIDNKEHIVEVFHVDNEVDFNVISHKDYAKTYGRIFHQE